MNDVDVVLVVKPLWEQRQLLKVESEVEARVEHDEGLGVCLSIGHPLRKQQIWHCLKLASDQLEAARARWLQEEQKQLAQAEAASVVVR